LNGPFYQSLKVDKNEIKDEQEEWFSAKAKLKNGEIIVGTREVKKPISVRYDWKSTDIDTLFNNSCLPSK